MKHQILLPKIGSQGSQLKFTGLWEVDHFRQGSWIDKYRFFNDIVNVGKNLILNAMFNGTTAIAQSAWAIGLISSVGFSALAASDTMSSHAGWTEFVDYSGGSRVAWGPGTSTAQSVTNATPNTFNITGSGTIQGIFVTSNNTLSGTSGTLWATALFTTPVPVVNGDQLKTTYTLNT